MKFFRNIINIKTLAVLVIGIVSLVSCEEFLNEDPQGLINPDTFVTSAENAESLLLSAYANMKYDPNRTDLGLHYFRGIWHFSEIPSDNCSLIFRTFDVSNFTTTPAYGNLNRTWEELYSVINRVNSVIDRVPNASGIDDADKNLLLGEARFIRAFMYFKLVRHFGGVPLRLTETTGISFDEINVAKSTAVQVYEQIEDDLLFAETNAPDSHASSDKGRGTSNAAKALLAKVYLQWAGNPINDTSKWQLAATKANEVTGSLMTNYDDVFNEANEGNDEVIFELVNTSGVARVWNPSQGGLLTRSCLPNTGRDFSETSSTDGYGAPGGFNDYIPSWDLFNSFDENDERRMGVDTTVVVDGNRFNFNRPFFWKFIDPNVIRGIEDGLDDGRNYPYLRYADVLLTRAEALNEVTPASSEALDLVNMIRERAGLSALTAIEVPDQDALRTLILEERRKELYMEESRLFDLVRQGVAVSTIQAFAQSEEAQDYSANVTVERMLLPIPQNEITSNEALSEADQNPGY